MGDRTSLRAIPSAGHRGPRWTRACTLRRKRDGPERREFEERGAGLEHRLPGGVIGDEVDVAGTYERERAFRFQGIVLASRSADLGCAPSLRLAMV